MDLKIDVLEQNDIVIINLGGRIDSFTISDLADTFKSIKEKGKKRILLSMKALVYINSGGFKQIVNFGKWIAEIGGDLKIADMQSNVRQLADIFQLDKITPIYDTSDKAIKSFDNRA